jgi:hypothetical protein
VISVLPNHNVDLLRLLAREHEAELRRTRLLVVDPHPKRRWRRWVGRQLVRYGTRLANEPTMRPARAR